MSILKNAFKSESTEKVKAIKCKLQSIKLESFQQYEAFRVKRKYILKATIETEFWANDAEKKRAEDAALKVLNHGIYKDIYFITSRMRSACYDGDIEAIFKLIDEIDSEIGL